MGVNEDKLAMLKGIFEEQRELTDEEMQAYKDMLQRKENYIGAITWEEAFKELLTYIGIYDLGIQRWFDENNGLWYDRRKHDHINVTEVIYRAKDALEIERE